MCYKQCVLKTAQVTRNEQKHVQCMKTAGIPLSPWILSKSSHSPSSFLNEEFLRRRSLPPKSPFSVSWVKGLSPSRMHHSFNRKLSSASTILTPNSESHSGSTMLRIPRKRNLRLSSPGPSSGVSDSSRLYRGEMLSIPLKRRQAHTLSLDHYVRE